MPLEPHGTVSRLSGLRDQLHACILDDFSRTGAIPSVVSTAIKFQVVFFGVFSLCVLVAHFQIIDGIDTEILISLVASKFMLWDKTLDLYRDRNATRKAWQEVWSALIPYFESISDAERNALGKYYLLNKVNTYLFLSAEETLHTILCFTFDK